MANKSHLKKGYTEVTRIINEQGEILSEDIKTNKYLTKDKDQFFIGYVKMLSVFLDLSGPSIKVYSYILATYQTDAMIGINMAVKLEIKKSIKSKASGVGVIDNCLSELVKSNMLFRKKNVTGGYYINPRYAFKGSTRDRDGALKVIIELGCKEC